MKKLILLSMLAVLPVVAQESSDGGNAQPPSRAPQRGEHARGDRAAHRQRLIQKFDVNKDGKLDEKEKAEMDKFIEQRRKEGRGPRGERSGRGPRGGQGPSREDIIRHFDKNQDGKLDDQERAEMEKAMKNRRPGRGEHRGQGQPPQE